MRASFPPAWPSSRPQSVESSPIPPRAGRGMVVFSSQKRSVTHQPPLEPRFASGRRPISPNLASTSSSVSVRRALHQAHQVAVAPAVSALLHRGGRRRGSRSARHRGCARRRRLHLVPGRRRPGYGSRPPPRRAAFWAVATALEAAALADGSAVADGGCRSRRGFGGCRGGRRSRRRRASCRRGSRARDLHADDDAQYPKERHAAAQANVKREFALLLPIVADSNGAERRRERLLIHPERRRKDVGLHGRRDAWTRPWPKEP